VDSRIKLDQYPIRIRLWLTGRFNEISWEVMGIFDLQENAVKACSTINDFVAPLILNEKLPEETRPWPGQYFPFVENK